MTTFSQIVAQAYNSANEFASMRKITTSHYCTAKHTSNMTAGDYFRRQFYHMYIDHDVRRLLQHNNLHW